MEEQLSEEEARRIKEFVDLHFSMDKSVFPVDMKVTDEMMETVSLTVNNLMQEKLQMINDVSGNKILEQWQENEDLGTFVGRNLVIWEKWTEIMEKGEFRT